MTTLIKLARYKRWADDLMLSDIAAIPHVEAIRVRPTRWDNMIRTMNHVRVVDDLFRAHLTGSDHHYTYRNTDETPSLDELRSMMKMLGDWYAQYAEALDANRAQEVVRFRFLDGGDGALTREDMILHIVNHATYHRGLVSDMMYQAGHVPTTNDLPVFLALAHGKHRVH